MNYDPHYVTTIDTFMSEWGYTKDKRNLLIFFCANHQQAQIVADNAKNRSDQTQVKIHDCKPWQWRDNPDLDEQEGYAVGDYYVQIKDSDSYPSWYVEDYFA